jgi:hypothetical protein
MPGIAAVRSVGGIVSSADEASVIEAPCHSGQKGGAAQVDGRHDPEHGRVAEVFCEKAAQKDAEPDAEAPCRQYG